MQEEPVQVRDVSPGMADVPPTAPPSTFLSVPETKSPTGSARGGRGGKVTRVKDIFAAIEKQPASSPVMDVKKVRRKSVPPLASSPTIPDPTPNKRHSMAIAPTVSAPVIPKVASIATTRPILPRTETVPTPAIVKKYTALPPVGWKGDRSAKQAFENVDVKEEILGRKRGPVGKLKALIDRFERW